MSGYRRYRISTKPAPNRFDHPTRFKVKVNRVKLMTLVVREMIETRGNLDVVLSRPCVYGVFSGPIGGMLPRDRLCVGCLRCTVQYPDMVQVIPNPERRQLGGGYLSPDQVDTIQYEAATGRVPVRGAGYRGAFGGEGWDGMWTDMSEIVRPTRDGIHGRETISTQVVLGRRPTMLDIGVDGRVHAGTLRLQSLPIPILFDAPPPAARSGAYLQAVVSAATSLGTLALLPFRGAVEGAVAGEAVAPMLNPEDASDLAAWPGAPRLVELLRDDEELRSAVAKRWPEAVIGLRVNRPEAVLPAVLAGYDLVHLEADPHGRFGAEHAVDGIFRAHQALVEAGVREQVSLIGSGGIVAAEHVPKAIIVGLDAVGLNLAPLIACQGQLDDGAMTAVSLPPLDPAWAEQRLTNLIASWRDQLLEILGAMGLREVRRLRGEVGRAMFQQDLEREAFADIPGFANHD